MIFATHFVLSSSYFWFLKSIFLSLLQELRKFCIFWKYNLYALRVVFFRPERNISWKGVNVCSVQIEHTVTQLLFKSFDITVIVICLLLLCIGCGEEIASSTRKLVALDCEMVGIGEKKNSALARCSIVDYHGYVLYDKYIKPAKKITDYRTRWSGILPIHMKTAVPFKLARREIRSIIKNKRVVGHSLHNDFSALKLKLRPKRVRDLAKNIQIRKIASLPTNKTPSLKHLTATILGRNIQCTTHCSIEDSVAAMDLYKTVEQEWELECNISRKYLSDSFWPS